MTQLRSGARQVPVDAKDLAGRIDGSVVTPEDEAWDDARQAWNLAADQRPAAVAIPESDGDVAAIVEFAREAGLRVAPQGTGHGAMALGPLEDTILVKLDRLRGVTIDAEATGRPRRRRDDLDRSRGGCGTARPGDARAVRRRTSASSATRWAAGSRGSAASTASAPTMSPRSRS